MIQTAPQCSTIDCLKVYPTNFRFTAELELSLLGVKSKHSRSVTLGSRSVSEPENFHYIRIGVEMLIPC